jgi:hypothetical protein
MRSRDYTAFDSHSLNGSSVCNSSTQRKNTFVRDEGIAQRAPRLAKSRNAGFEPAWLTVRHAELATKYFPSALRG